MQLASHLWSALVYALSSWIFDISVARSASEYLASEMELEAFAKKYAEGLSEHYDSILTEAISVTSMQCLQFLSEIEAGEIATELLDGFSYYRYMNESVANHGDKTPFGSLEDGTKVQEWTGEATVKAFKAYVFGLRSNTVPKAPAGWRLEDNESTPNLAELAGKSFLY